MFLFHGRKMRNMNSQWFSLSFCERCLLSNGFKICYMTPRTCQQKHSFHLPSAHCTCKWCLPPTQISLKAIDAACCTCLVLSTICAGLFGGSEANSNWEIISKEERKKSGRVLTSAQWKSRRPWCRRFGWLIVVLFRSYALPMMSFRIHTVDGSEIRQTTTWNV